MIAVKNLLPPFFGKICMMHRSCHQLKGDPRTAHFMRKLMGRKSQQNLLHPKEIISSQGKPTFLTANKGDSKTIKRRQLMINKHFMQGISDVLAYEEFYNVIKADKVSITHISVGQHFNHVNIYWTTGQVDCKQVEKKLNSMIPELAKKLIERNFMSSLPVIRFCFDCHKVNEEMLDSAFKTLSIRSDATKHVPPSKQATGYSLDNPYGPKRWSRKLVRFDEQFKEEQEARQENLLSMKMNYTYSKFEAPPDMALNCAGLDYAKYMNQVHERLRKVRATANSFVADPLPPAHWVDPPNLLPPPDGSSHRDPKLTTEYRLNAVKNFILGNRKKKFFTHKMQERVKDEHDQLIVEDLEEAKMRMQAQDAEAFNDIICEDEEEEEANLWCDDDVDGENEK